MRKRIIYTDDNRDIQTIICQKRNSLPKFPTFNT